MSKATTGEAEVLRLRQVGLGLEAKHQPGGSPRVPHGSALGRPRWDKIPRTLHPASRGNPALSAEHQRVPRVAEHQRVPRVAGP